MTSCVSVDREGSQALPSTPPLPYSRGAGTQIHRRGRTGRSSVHIQREGDVRGWAYSRCLSPASPVAAPCPPDRSGCHRAIFGTAVRCGLVLAASGAHLSERKRDASTIASSTAKDGGHCAYRASIETLGGRTG